MKHFKIKQTITDRKESSIELYFKDICRTDLLTPGEELKLTEELKKGSKEAEDKLIVANLRFVVSIAKQYQNKGVPLTDLVQEGSLGLIEGAKKYNPDKGCRFITYTAWWIRQSIIKAISDQCRTVKVPINRSMDMSKIRKMVDKFEQNNERSPSNYEIEEQTGMNEDKINNSLTSTFRSISLETPTYDDTANTLIETIPNVNSESTDSIVVRSDLFYILDNILNKLPNRESDIIRMLFGIGVEKMSSDEIANRFGITAERVRQIQHSVLKKIKDKYSNDLIDLL